MCWRHLIGWTKPARPWTKRGDGPGQATRGSSKALLLHRTGASEAGYEAYLKVLDLLSDDGAPQMARRTELLA